IARNGPTPVCTSARRKLSQSRPRSVSREGDVLVSMEVSGSRARLIRNLLFVLSDPVSHLEASAVSSREAPASRFVATSQPLPEESTIYLTHSSHAHPTINVITVI